MLNSGIQLIEGRHTRPDPIWPRRYLCISEAFEEATLDNGDNFAMQVFPEFNWGGPTMFPVFRPETSPVLYGSMFHDALYFGWESAAFTNGRFRVWINGEPADYWGRHQADQFFRRILVKHGMTLPAAYLIDQVIDVFGDKFGVGNIW